MSENKTLGVGIIGASAERGWAKDSHIPAVQRLSGLQLAAVASGNQTKAEAAAKLFGATAGYGSTEALIHDPHVDIVSVAVKVPDHRELVLAALTAGKHVYCEWPLGRDVAETELLTTAAHKAGVHVAIGLQARLNPAARCASELIAAGAIGRVLSARLYSATVAFGPKWGAADAYLDDPANGATLVSIHVGHPLDLACMVLGPFTEVAALTTTQYTEIEVGDDAKRRPRVIPDHLLMQARLARGGGAFSLEVAGGRPMGATPFRLEVTGESGNLVLEGGAPRGFQSGRLHVMLKGQLEAVDEGEMAALPDAAVNVAGLYAALRDDVLGNTSTAPDFDHAVRLARLLDTVCEAGEKGTRLPVTK